MTTETHQERFDFQAEVVQLLDLMIHSLYSNKEIFLRELVSNASDANDRLRFESLTQADLRQDDDPLEIHVSLDTDARTITVRDNGIGMSRQEVMDNIGTIAKSGTRQFLASLTGDQRRDSALIGQFGVGFYSAFVVADRVTVTTRRAGQPSSDGVRWESDGRGEYTLETVERPSRGTEVVLHLRDGEDELLNEHRLRSIVRKYSDHISWPILMSGEPVNQASALWVRPKNEISEQDYTEFYKHIAHDLTDPLAHVHSRIEGLQEYTLLLFVPGKAPFDLWTTESRRGVRLFVQRVFIMEDDGHLMPTYLRFVRGVIDSSDLPLNISREILQSNPLVSRIRSNAVKKVLKLLEDIAANEPDRYATFYREFGAVLKEGIVEDHTNRDTIARLLRFTTTHSTTEEPDVSLEDYVARMKEGQDTIYYLVGSSLTAARNSPHLEVFRDKGVEVLLLGDLVDNWLVTHLREYEGKPLRSVAQGASDLGDLADEREKETRDRADTEYADLLARMRTCLGDRVHEVRVSDRLTDSPACIVADEPELDFNVARRVRGSGLPSQPVLEINPRHALLRRLNRDPHADDVADWAHVLYNQAVLTFGAQIEDPAAFVGRLNTLLVALTAEERAAVTAEETETG